MGMGNSKTDKSSSVGRIKTGVSELDKVLYGGLPEGSQTVILGQAGTGKSILAFQIVYNNAKQGIPCTVVLLDQRREDFLKNISNAFTHFDDLDELMDKKLINISENIADDKFTSREAIMTFIAGIIKAAQSNKSKVVVLDELSLLRVLLSDDREFTRTLNYITENLHIIGVTSIITMELAEGSTKTDIPGLLEESMFDGVIRLKNVVKGDEVEHVCAVIKMRYSKYKSTSNTMKITPDGVVLNPAG